MPFAPAIRTKFSTPGLVAQIIANLTFAQRGYLWGFDGSVYYCFLNPDKVRFEIWKKQWHLAPFLFTLFSALLGFYFWGAKGAAIGALETLFVPFLLYKHYYATAEEQKAGVVTNGPQMRLPGNMQFDTVAALTALLLIVPTLAGAIIGLVAGTVKLPVLGTLSGWVVGLAVGALTGINLVALFLLLLGLLATPYGSVISPPVSENVPAEPFTYYFGRSGTPFSAYSIGPNNPIAGLTWASGGLQPMVIAGASAGTVAGQIGVSYTNLVGNPREEVIWALIPFGSDPETAIREAFASQDAIYQGKYPTGLILVAGSERWINAYTLNLITHKVRDAVATDGSQSALLGSSGQFLIGGAWSIFNVGSYRDPIQRYGFMGVPE